MPGQSLHPKQRRGIADDLFVLQREHRLKVAIVVSGDVALGPENSFRVRQRTSSRNRYAVRASLNCADRASPTVRSTPQLHRSWPGQIREESWRDYSPLVVLARVQIAGERVELRTHHDPDGRAEPPGFVVFRSRHRGAGGWANRGTPPP
jgi:hypothetical protein